MRIVILTSKTLRSKIVYHYLNNKYDIVGVIVDNSGGISKAKKRRVKRRVKRLGIIKVALQILFCRMVLPVLRNVSKDRVKEIVGENGVSTPNTHKNHIIANSINDKTVTDFIQKENPDLIIVHGTSIISAGTLSKINCPIINFHIGITPQYRGLHGGYWALFNRDEKNFGSTVHYVDSGIDSGEILAQKKISISKRDNFYTYQILQTVHCLDCFDEAIKRIKKNTKLKLQKRTVLNGYKSKYYSHPTITEYLYGRLVLGVK